LSLASLPNILTVGRIVAVPLVVVLFYWTHPWSNPLAAVVFIAAAITDSLDGYLARRMGITTALGEFLDPVADKLMVSAALIVLLSLDRVDAFVALVIIGREIAVSALREWMAQLGKSGSVAVNWFGKIKTIAQMVAIPMLLFHDRLFGVIDVQLIGTVLIYVAAVLTVYSMLIYLRLAWPHLSGHV
jgi:CDP-diacylglycerol--glycerol-3-phosphate 3-phosphatidyltransferase